MTVKRVILYTQPDDRPRSTSSSPEGQATAADFQKIAPTGSRMFVQVLED